MMRKLRSNKRIRLCVEELEERCLLSYLVEDYGPFTLTVGTEMASIDGSHISYVNYLPDEESVWQVDLNPISPQEVQSFSAAEYAALTARFPGWTFSSSTETLADDSLKIKDYEAFWELAYDYEGNELDIVGAEIWIAYNPTGIDPVNIHWIQIVTTNAPTGGFSPFVDLTNPETQSTPYYDDGSWANNTGFTDRPSRVHEGYGYTWSATLLVVEETAPSTVKIWQGLRWGWESWTWFGPEGPSGSPSGPYSGHDHRSIRPIPIDFGSTGESKSPSPLTKSETIFSSFPAFQLAPIQVFAELQMSKAERPFQAYETQGNDPSAIELAQAQVLMQPQISETESGFQDFEAKGNDSSVFPGSLPGKGRSQPSLIDAAFANEAFTVDVMSQDLEANSDDLGSWPLTLDGREQN